MITLTRLREFRNDPAEFPRQLKQLEDNVSDAVKKLDGAFLPNFSVTRRETHARVNAGEYAVANTVSSDITFTFPAPSALNAGKAIAVKKTSAAFTLTVAVASGTVSGSISELLGTAGRLYLYISDGSDWTRTG